MRWSAALTTSRPSALAVALACATGSIATREVAAQPNATADRPAARPASRGHRAKKPLAVSAPVAVAAPAPSARGELLQ
ncbi:MAG: hypothetical protein ABIY55_12410, partial [Kofleriaceae bacterium]